MAAPTYRSRWPRYAAKWDSMQIVPERSKEVASVARRLHAAKARYQKIEKATGVPWYMIAVLHERESGQNWTRSLGQGDPWNRVSTHVPRGRGPFASFEAAAIDALVTLKKLNRVIDWRIEKVLYYCEQYNGWGYYYKGITSPYIFGGSTIQQWGKYTADGPKGWNPNAWDSQLGCATIIKAMMTIDKTINPVRET